MGTFVARMGQCFSTSMDTVGIDVNEGASWEEDYDVKTPDEKYCFSDGVGRISVTLAKQVSLADPSVYLTGFALRWTDRRTDGGMREGGKDRWIDGKIDY